MEKQKAFIPVDAIEGNKLIAEFDGKKWKPVKAGFEQGGSFVFIAEYFDTQEACLEVCNELNKGLHPDECYFPKPDAPNLELKYHSDWNWLMPVWKKFISLTFESVSERHYHNQVKQVAIKSLSDADIDNFFKDVVMAIKWYNNLNR